MYALMRAITAGSGFTSVTLSVRCRRNHATKAAYNPGSVVVF
jgi:hypothetical protein